MRTSVKGPAEREGFRRDKLRRLRARIESDVAQLRMGGEGIATVLDHLVQSCAKIDDYLAESGPTLGDRQRRQHRADRSNPI